MDHSQLPLAPKDPQERVAARDRALAKWGENKKPLAPTDPEERAEAVRRFIAKHLDENGKPRRANERKRWPLPAPTDTQEITEANARALAQWKEVKKSREDLVSIVVWIATFLFAATLWIIPWLLSGP
jgi:hypothetical protein